MVESFPHGVTKRSKMELYFHEKKARLKIVLGLPLEYEKKEIIKTFLNVVYISSEENYH